MNARKNGFRFRAAGVGAGAALAGRLASACCVGPSLAPIAISVLGAGGLIAVSALRPYTPLLLVGGLRYCSRSVFDRFTGANLPAPTRADYESRKSLHGLLPFYGRLPSPTPYTDSSTNENTCAVEVFC